ncbi:MULTISPECIES: hypothetical protein [unclassified Duganella]|uniref:hypothetical protein n=1 Tax=unclassified Duganella TaxID=2636909 RepID=UPI0006F274B5|nr:MULTISPECIES: hypothetical protein [unclassified Duganella]KQV53937.1 hypothetical protein ASD07_05165 [Duganella sp. Root336D2]KRB98149.1 hypothetical protein ASE26_24845 [Duganella sp. Root198D2]
MKKLYVPGLLAALVCAMPTAQANCHAALKERLPQSGTVIFGEMHGTNEIPAFFSACVREFVEHGEPVRVFLEFDASDTEHTAQYLRGEIDEAALLSSPRWRRLDGRTSRAMLELHRALKGVQVVGFAPLYGVADINAGMGENFLQHRLENGYNLVLVGGVHAQVSAGKGDVYASVPFGQYIQARSKNVLSLNARYTRGNAWTCSPYCDASPLAGNEPTGATPARSIGFGGNDRRFDGYFSVGAATASPPAVERK